MMPIVLATFAAVGAVGVIWWAAARLFGPRRPPVQSITINDKRRQEFSDGERH